MSNSNIKIANYFAFLGPDQNTDGIYVYQNNVLTIVLKRNGNYWFIDLYRDDYWDKELLDEYVERTVRNAMQDSTEFDKFILLEFENKRIHKYLKKYEIK